jgi:APA family basic amino acid/polyamine antiporter
MAELKRALGFASLLFVGVGVIVGAGIYSVIGAAAGQAGHALWLSFLLAAVPAGLTALNYAELVAMFPRVGAEYTFTREAFPERRWVSFGVGFAVVLTNASTAAAVALAFGGYLEQFADVPRAVGALGLLLSCTAVNAAGIRESTGIAVGFTLLELAGLALVVWAGADSGRFAAGAFAAPPPGVFAGAALIFFVYTGFEGIANLAEEAKHPERDLPRALIASGALTLVVYLSVAFAVVGLASPAELAESAAPLATALADSPRLAATVAAIALFSTANTALITLVVASRILLGMARQHDMPGVLARVSERRGAPVTAAWVVLGGSALLLPVGDVAIASSVSSLATLLSFLAVAIAVIALRRRRPELERPFRVPLALRGVPLPAVLAIAAVLALATQFPPAAFSICGAALALGVGLGLTRRYWGPPS